MKTIKFLFADLNQDERQILGGVVIFISGAMFLIWMMSTVRPPVKDSLSIDHQTYHKSTYQLSKSYNNYAQRIYNEKYGK